MKNPLNKRIPRELIQDLGKYIVIFLFMIATIGFISGFLVADNSMVSAFDESFEKYNTEDGNFEIKEKAEKSETRTIEKEGVKLYENFYTEQQTGKKNTLRIFANRKTVNMPCVMEGRLASEKDEIAVDRLYAEYNELQVGDSLRVGDQKLKIVGTVALPDYSGLFQNNADMIFDADNFGVALVSEAQLKHYDKIKYSYSWKNNTNDMTIKEKKDFSDDLMERVAKVGLLKNFVAEQDNQAIHFAGDDMGQDKAMVTILLYIIIVIMAFIFGVTIRNTIDKEAGVIGTLRASGYTKGEMFRHYLLLPVLVTFIAAGIGNVIGYTVMKKVIADMYYHSYCLPTYKTLWNAEAFVMTTVIPLLIMILVNSMVLIRKLSLSPLKFIRHDLSRKKKKRAMKLRHFSFMNRFRLRIIIQNLPNYLMIFIGILFSNILLMFGLMFVPLLDNFGDTVEETMLSQYQYILKAPVDTKVDGAEKIYLNTLKLPDSENADEMTIYGVEKESKYVHANLSNQSDKGVCVSDGILEKYGYELGDTITLADKYSGKKYTFTIQSSIDYPASLAVFMDEKQYRETFDVEKEMFNGYFSDKELTDIKTESIASKVTEKEMTKMVRQLKNSMGSLFPMIAGFAVLMAVLVIYLLSKIVIEKNANAISMVKILGYKNGEISGLYIASTSIIVFLSIIVSLPISFYTIEAIYGNIMSSFAGWIHLYIGWDIYVKMVLLVGGSYILVALLQFWKIKKVPLEDVLKNAAE